MLNEMLLRSIRCLGPSGRGRRFSGWVWGGVFFFCGGWGESFEPFFWVMLHRKPRGAEPLAHDRRSEVYENATWAVTPAEVRAPEQFFKALCTFCCALFTWRLWDGTAVSFLDVFKNNSSREFPRHECTW